MVNKLYQLDCAAESSEMATPASAQQYNRLDTWHCLDTWDYRLGHASEQCVKNMAYGKLVTVIRLPKRVQLLFCEACIKGKMQRKHFPSLREVRSKRRLQLVHSDVCGPIPTVSIGGNKYFVTFVDDYSRYCAVYFLKNKA